MHKILAFALVGNEWNLYLKYILGLFVQLLIYSTGFQLQTYINWKLSNILFPLINSNIPTDENIMSFDV